jgi:hypothetical protein
MMADNTIDVHVLLLAVVVAACGAPRPKATPSSENANDAPGAADAGEAHATVAPCLRLHWLLAASCIEKLRLDDPHPVEPKNWLVARGAEEKLAVETVGDGQWTCMERRLDSETILLCDHVVDGPEWLELASLKVLTVRTGKPMVVVDLPHTIGLRSGDPRPNTNALAFALNVDLKNAPIELRLSLPKPSACADADAFIINEPIIVPDSEGRGANVSSATSLRRIKRGYLERVCRAAGSWVWTNGTYRLVQ